VLQAADILLYQTDLVPVGEDQRQHIEITRDIAQRFNARFGEAFTLPDVMIPEVGGRIMDLQEPEKKMSTTGGTPQGTVLVVDPPDVIRRKFKTAVTDSGREVVRAADILLYQTDVVPIGDDQRQHLELARNVAERFNSRFGETFRPPEAMIPEVGGRIMDLQEPEKKMSTTGGTAQGTVGVLDLPDTIRKKFKSAVTDSGSDVRHDPEQKAGISNLIEIMAIATGREIPAIEAHYDGGGYGTFKEEVGEAVVALFDPIRLRYEELRTDPAELERLLGLGADKAREASAPTLEQMYQRMGFVRP
jgi:tryptophanyl-tRNA synthetase